VGGAKSAAHRGRISNFQECLARVVTEDRVAKLYLSRRLSGIVGTTGRQVSDAARFLRRSRNRLSRYLSVELDFSVLNWEFEEFRQSLTEFSLQGIMQSKQFWRLHELQV
jgi:hypothetical protein